MRTPDRQQSTLGLIAWLESTRVRLPLTAVECGFDIFGDIAGVQIEQVFAQDNAVALDVTYTFPLPAGAAVYRCEMIVDDRVIRAVVKEEHEARALAAKLKAEGRRVARTEAPRENLFTLDLGNVQPGDTIIIRLRYFQLLDRIGDLLSLMIPTCPGIRYIPGRPLLRSNRGQGTADDTDQVPDASKISPPRIAHPHPDAAHFAVEGTISAAGTDPGSVSSPSHPVIVARADDRLEVRLAPAPSWPDRDFILRWKESARAETSLRTICHRAGGYSYAAVRVTAPGDLPDGPTDPGDVYLLVDRSGSMAGIKWAKAAEALRRFASELSPADRAFITLFESVFIDFDERPIPRDELLADPAFAGIAEQGTAGGTELLPALEHVVEKIRAHSRDRRATVVIITDGEVGNEEQVHRALADARDFTVHCFGIDTAVNDAFLKRLAGDHGGGCLLLNPHDNIPQAVAALAVRLRKPALLGLAPADGWELPRETRADVHAGEAATIVCRGPLDARELRLAGERADGSPATFTFALGSDGTEAPRLLWAKERIAGLLAAGEKDEAIRCAIEHNLACEGTSFLAWDDAEQVPVAKRELYQPSMAPAEWEDSRGGQIHRAPMVSFGGPMLSDNGDTIGLREDASRRHCAPPTSPNGDLGSGAPTPSAASPDLRARHPKRRGGRRSLLGGQPPAPCPPTEPPPPRQRIEELSARYARFAYAALPFPAGRVAAPTIRGRWFALRVRKELLDALGHLPETLCRVIVGIMMVWAVREGKHRLGDRLTALESIAGNVRGVPLQEALARIADRLSGEEAESIRELISLLSGKPSGAREK